MEIITNVDLSKTATSMISNLANFIEAEKVEYYDDGVGEKYIFEKKGQKGHIYVSSLPSHGAWITFEIKE
jgi:hypothetical protein